MADLLSELEEDLLLRVLALLPPSALLALGGCSAQLRELAERDELWAPLCARTWSLPVAWAARARSWPALDGRGGPAYRKLPPPRVSGAARGCELVCLCGLRSQPETNGRLALRLAYDGGRERWVVALLHARAPLPRAGAEPSTQNALDELKFVRAESLRPALPARWAAPAAGGGREAGSEGEEEEVEGAEWAGAGRAPPPRCAWKGAWAQRRFTDALVGAELERAAVRFAPRSAAARRLLAERRWGEEGGAEGEADGVARLVMRALGEFAWEALWAHLPASLRRRSGRCGGGGRGEGSAGGEGEGGPEGEEREEGPLYLRGARTPWEAVLAEAAAAQPAALPAPPRQPCAAASAVVSFAFLREINADLRLRDWLRIHALLHAAETGATGGREPTLECGALVISAWDDPLCNVGGIARRLGHLASRVGQAVREAGGSGGREGASLPPLENATAEAAAAAAAADAAAFSEASAPAPPPASASASASAAPCVRLGVPRAELLAANRILFEEEGLNRTERSYYDVRNSLLQYVLLCGQWKHGLPIALAVVYQAVCARLGLALLPVSLPFHFVLAVPTHAPAAGTGGAVGGAAEERLLVDVFSRGRLLSLADARALVGSRSPLAWSDELAQPCGPREVWGRMLRNLVHAGQQAAQQAGSARAAVEPYGALLAWASASAEQRRARVQADLVLRALMAPDRPHLAASRAAAAADVRAAAGGARPRWAASGAGGAFGGSEPADGCVAWPDALSVTELLGLWEPWC